jgi:excisionase family DNA binding protein
MVSFDLNEAADFLKMHRESLRRLAISGDVPARKVGKKWVFIREHLADYVSGRYIQRAGGLRVVDGGKTTWHSKKETASGTSTSSPQTANAYDELLGLKTNNKPKSCTTASKRKPGG